MIVIRVSIWRPRSQTCFDGMVHASLTRSQPALWCECERFDSRLVDCKYSCRTNQSEDGLRPGASSMARLWVALFLQFILRLVLRDCRSAVPCKGLSRCSVSSCLFLACFL